jgi:large subunit ribosomal protein L25
MGLPTLKTKERTTFGKSSTKKLRYQGLIPAVIYGEDKEAIHVVFELRDIQHLFRTEENGRNTIIELEIETKKETKKETVLTYQMQNNAITRTIEHIDFIRISDKTKIRATVSVELEGSAPGIKLGGVLIHQLREVVIKCLPQNIPSSIKVDMSKLDINDFIKVKDLNLGEISLITSLDDTIVRIAAPRTLVEESEEATTGEAGEEGEEGADAESDKDGKDTPKSDSKSDDKKDSN